jgi:hypothetical protein
MATLQKEVGHNFGPGSQTIPRLLSAHSKWTFSNSTLLDPINATLPNPRTFEKFLTFYFIYDGAVRYLPAAELDNHPSSVICNC